MLKTMDLQYIYEVLQDDIFDFDYDFPDITINDKVITKTSIQDDFKDFWWFYQIGYSTLDEFKWRFKRVWLDKIYTLRQRLSQYPELDNLNLTGKTIDKTYTNDNDNKYSDTPNQPMVSEDSSNVFLTDRTITNTTGSHNETETDNVLEQYEKLHKYMRNVEYDFFKEFKSLFITDVIIYDGILKGGL